jgi:hypothetical protein
MKKWQKVVDLTETLPIDYNIDKLILTKLLLRRSNALIQLKKYELAIDSLGDCISIDPSNTASIFNHKST